MKLCIELMVLGFVYVRMYIHDAWCVLNVVVKVVLLLCL